MIERQCKVSVVQNSKYYVLAIKNMLFLNKREKNELEYYRNSTIKPINSYIPVLFCFL